MTSISPLDASVLALIAGHRMSKVQAEKMLDKANSSAITRRIARRLVDPKARVGNIEREAATSIRHWADTQTR